MAPVIPGPLTEPLRVGDIVRTNYDTGPYRIIRIGGGDANVSFACLDADYEKPTHRSHDESYLNGYFYQGGRCIGNYAYPKGSSGYQSIARHSDPSDTAYKRHETLLVRRGTGRETEAFAADRENPAPAYVLFVPAPPAASDTLLTEAAQSVTREERQMRMEL